MFKFAFSDNKSENDHKDAVNTIVNTASGKSGNKWLPSDELFISDNSLYLELLGRDKNSVHLIELEGKVNIKYASNNFINELLSNTPTSENPIIHANQNHSDLVTAIYEGGLKIWQCTYDLLYHVYEEDIDFKNKNVLDLGCGAGILGLYAYLTGGNVCFQDYNPEVIQYVTMPNVLVNTPEEKEIKNVKFFSGDWESFMSKTKKFESEKFDYILTSETIYNCDNYIKLNEVFKELLKPTGTIYLAAKTYYFGVGGGLRSFEDMIKADNVFNFTSVWHNSEGVQREILILRFKSPKN